MNLSSFVCRRQLGECRGRPALLRRRLRSARGLFAKDLFGHFGCVNALEFSPGGDLLLSGGDDHRVLLWSLSAAVGQEPGQDYAKKGPFRVLKARHASNIFCLDFDAGVSRAFSGGNDEQVIVHDLETGKPVDVFAHDEPVYGVSASPAHPSLFATACSDGGLQLFDLRLPSTNKDPSLLLAAYPAPFHAVCFNPAAPRLLAAANQHHGAALWDVRRPRRVVMEYGNVSGRPESAMSVRFDSSGARLLALRRRLPPALYDLHSPVARCQFDHPGYYNSCTMKSCCFAGMDDEFVMSGSDDFNLYMWRIPEEEDKTFVDGAHLVLNGHRSIVNQVRFSKATCSAASAGVEKVIKLWSSLPLPKSKGSIDPDSAPETGVPHLGRKVYSREEYVRLSLESGSFMTHDYSAESTEENPRMMAFFDSLVQREVEGNSSSSDDGGDDGVNEDRGELGNSPRPLGSPRTEREDEDEEERDDSSWRISHLIARRRQQMAKRAANSFSRGMPCKRRAGAAAATEVNATYVRRAMLKAMNVISVSTDNSSEEEEKEEEATSSNTEGSDTDSDDGTDFIGPRLPSPDHSSRLGEVNNGAEEDTVIQREATSNSIPRALLSLPEEGPAAGLMSEEIRLALSEEEELPGDRRNVRNGDESDNPVPPVPSTSTSNNGSRFLGISTRASPPPRSSSPGPSSSSSSEVRPHFKKSSRAKRAKRCYRKSSEEHSSD